MKKLSLGAGWWIDDIGCLNAWFAVRAQVRLLPASVRVRCGAQQGAVEAVRGDMGRQAEALAGVCLVARRQAV